MNKKIISVIIALVLVCQSAYTPIATKASNTDDITFETSTEDRQQQVNFTIQLNIDGNYVITGYEGDAEYLEIPSEYNGRKIIGLTQYAIYNDDKLKEITFEEGFEFLESFSIFGCDNLERINLPSTVTKYGFGLGYGPICSCSSLIEINVDTRNKELISEEGILFSKDMKTIMYYPAAITDSLYTIPEGVETIYYYCFNHNCNLKKVIIPDTIKEIQFGAFDTCRNLSEVNIPNGCEELGQFVFYMTSIETIEIPSSVTFLNSGALSTMHKLKSVNVAKGNSVYYSEDGILYCAKNKTLETYPAMKTDTEYDVPYGITNLGMYAIENNKYLETVRLPETVTYIGHGNFFNCKNLKSLYVPYSVNKIKENCFSNDDLTIYGYEGSYIEEYVSKFDNETATLRFSSIGNYKELTVERGKKFTPYCYIEYRSGDIEDIVWSTSDSNIAKVSNATDANSGRITAVKPGTAIVKASVTGYEAVFKVNVSKKHIKSLKFSKSNVNITKGKSKILKVNVLPNDADDTLAFKSSNNKIASVDKNGKVTAKKAGTVTITVTSSNGLKATCKVKVKEIHVKKLKLSKTNLKLKKGKTKKLKVTVNPTSYTDTLKWKSSNKKVATVDKKGRVVAKRKGTAKITVKSSNGKKATCKVTVK